jgi:hypothetical protein
MWTRLLVTPPSFIDGAKVSLLGPVTSNTSNLIISNHQIFYSHHFVSVLLTIVGVAEAVTN